MPEVLTVITAVFVAAWFLCFIYQSGITFNGRLEIFANG